MPEYPGTDQSSDSESVLVVSSEPGGDGARAFTVIGPKAGETFLLPSDLATEADLVRAMEGRGYRLTMVGGGSRIDEIRRFYFRVGGGTTREPEGAR